MNKYANVALSLLMGLLGGLIGRYLTPHTVFAQNRTAPRIPNAFSLPKEIRAQSFTLVSPDGRARATFTFDAANNRVVLRDAGQNEIWAAGGSSIRLLGQR